LLKYSTLRHIQLGFGFAAVTLMLGAATGCKSVMEGPVNPAHWFHSTPQYDTPEQIMVVWIDAVQNVPGVKPRRGCGGRLYFFDKKSRAIPVNGTLIVYAFDDAEQTDDMTQPQARYVFSPSKFTESLSQSDLGTSYNIWIPWDELGNPQKKLTLITVFKDATGRIVQADPAFVVLPGRVELTPRQKRGFYEPDAQSGQSRSLPNIDPREQTGTMPQRRINSMTIPLPRSLSQKMQASPPVLRIDKEAQRQQLNRTQPWSMNLSPTESTTPVGKPDVTSSSSVSRSVTSGIVAPANSLGYQGYAGVEAEHTLTGRAKAWSRQDPRSARFSRQRFQAPSSTASRPVSSGDRSEPRPEVRQWSRQVLPGLNRTFSEQPGQARDAS
jgi:hypothetical protein